MNVLVVDDSRTDRELIGSVVGNAGHKVIYAENGEDCLQKAELHRPELIFLDIVMPGLDGFATCRRLRRNQDLKEVPVVMVTHKNTSSDQFYAQKQGASGYIPKPFDESMINDVLKQYT